MGSLSCPLFSSPASLVRPSDQQGTHWVCRAAGLSQVLQGAPWDGPEDSVGAWENIGGLVDTQQMGNHRPDFFSLVFCP